MMKKGLVVCFLILIGGFGGYLFSQIQVQTPGVLSSQEKLDRIINQRDQAIKEAVKEGIYRCCIEPPCTMCYLEANRWNNYQAGTCACDDLIAQGKEPCPQCREGLCQEAKTCQPENP